MQNIFIFSARLKHIRESYKIASKELAFAINVSNKASVSKWEKGNNWPQIDMLLNMSKFFGVTLDWLTGNADSPLSDSLLSKLEASMIACDQSGAGVFEFYNGDSNDKYTISLPDKYALDSSRKSLYSLEERATIVFYYSLFMLSQIHAPYEDDPRKSTFKAYPYFRLKNDMLNLLGQSSKAPKPIDFEYITSQAYEYARVLESIAK